MPQCGHMSPTATSAHTSHTHTTTTTTIINNNNMMTKQVNNEDVGIREVWATNMEEEFKAICRTVEKFPYVAMDTEFPGVGEYFYEVYFHTVSFQVVARPIGDFKSTADYQYQLLRCNVDLLKIIQLGLTFLDAQGNMPEGITTWQFNFKFNLTEDMYAEDSVDLLQNSGIKFEKHEREGIETTHFAEMLLVSGKRKC